MPQGVQRRLAAILAADIAGYARLMEADEERTLTRLRAHRHQLIDPKVREHHGRVVKTTGDGALVEFASAVDAVRCAAEIQRVMLDREAEIAEDRRIRFRIGVNLGDIMVEDGDIFGDGVNIAARLEALAEPGGVCISAVVRDQIGDKVPFRFEDMGEQVVKNIARPVHAYLMGAAAVAALPPAVVAEMPKGDTQRPQHWPLLLAAASVALLVVGAVGGWWAWSSRGGGNAAPAAAAPAKAVPPLSMVVLPFENLSKDPDQEYFADGVTDDLTTELSRIADSFVISRTTAFTYKNKTVDVRRIGRDLGVRYVLEGSVRRSGDQVHVNVQLIDAATESHVWADQFDTDRANLAQAQDGITGRLANSLHVALVRDASRRIAAQTSNNPSAQDLVMRGWAWYYRPATRDNRQRSRQAFEEALAIDPHSLDAKNGLARALVVAILDGWAASRQMDEARAEQLTDEVLDRDPQNPQAHWTKGVIARLQNRFGESEAELERAITLDPNFAEAYFQLGITTLLLGRPQPAIPLIEKAARLNPQSPVLGIYFFYLATAHLYLEDVNDAIGLLQKAVAANPEPYFIHLWLAAALGLASRVDEAKAEIAQSIKINPSVNSLARAKAARPWGNSDYWTLFDKTVATGLRRAGFPDK
jgi:adenylate cyclase